MGGNMIRKSRLITTMVMIVTILMLWSATASGLNQIRLGCPATMNPIVPGDSVSIPVYITNDTVLGGFSLGFKWNSPYIRISSADLTGSALTPSQQEEWQQLIYALPTRLALFGWVGVNSSSFPKHEEEVLLFSMNAVVLEGATSACVDLDSAFVRPAGYFMFAPVVHSGRLVPEYVDCLSSEIILGTPPFCPTHNNPPVAICHEVYVVADSMCRAAASIDNGSFDSDTLDGVTLRQAPTGPYNLGHTIVHLIVTDFFGAEDTCQSVVHVLDSLGPIIHCPSDIVKPVAMGYLGRRVYYTVTALDPCDPAPPLVTTPPSGSFFPVGVTTVTSIASSAAGEADTCQFEVQVVEVEPVCGDADGTVELDISDAVFLIENIFSWGEVTIPVANGDANCDGVVGILDVMYLIAYIFTGGPAPCAGC
jgi:hypothetical protein